LYSIYESQLGKCPFLHVGFRLLMNAICQQVLLRRSSQSENYLFKLLTLTKHFSFSAWAILSVYMHAAGLYFCLSSCPFTITAG
jgi:hypothetical protein